MTLKSSFSISKLWCLWKWRHSVIFSSVNCNRKRPPLRKYNVNFLRHYYLNNKKHLLLLFIRFPSVCVNISRPDGVILLIKIEVKWIYRVIQNACRMTFRCCSPGHFVLQMQPHVISFYGVTSRIRFMFLLFPQVSRNWRYESEPPLKPSPLTCYKHWIKVDQLEVTYFIMSIYCSTCFGC